MTEKELRALAVTDPGRLLDMLSRWSLPPEVLTFAAEHAGRLPDARPLLIALLNHTSPVVREGAIYGLVHHLEAPHIQDGEVRTLLRLVAADDTSPGVRAAAAEALTETA